MIKMEQLRPVSKKEMIVFPIMVTIVVSLLLPSAAPLVGMLMLGNLLRVSGVADRLSKTAQNELMNIVTIFLGTTVGATAKGATFLTVDTLVILAMGVFAFCMGTAGGVLLAQAHVPPDARQDQPAHRFCRRFRRAYGRARFSGRGPEGKSVQLPAYARHGSQRRGRYRFGRRRRACSCAMGAK